MLHITEKTKEYECCCSCKHNKRKKDGENIYCECEIDGHYIGYIACFDNVCERWKKNNMDYETLRNSMTVQDAARVLRDTNCYGTMDIAKNVILKALEEQMSSSEKPNKWINKPQESEDEKVIRIKKGTLKARTGKYVVYDVEWLKTHFNTTEAKIYGQPKVEGTRGDIPLQQSVPKMPQPNERTEERTEMTREDAIKIFNTLLLFGKCDLRKEEAEECFKMAIKALEEQPNEHTEMHECDYISRKAVLDALHSYFANGFDGDKWWNSTYVLDAVNRVPSATPQPKIGQPKTGHWIYSKAVNTGEIIWSKCSKCGNEERGCAQRMKYCPECGIKMEKEQ